MKRTCFALLMILAGAAVSFGQTTFYFPHVANGVLGTATWKTTIFLTNPAASGGATASGSVTFMKDNADPNQPGSAFAISFVDENGAAVGSGNTIPFQIAPGQTRKFVSTGTGGYAGGFATATSTAAISGTSIFSEFVGGKLIGEATVPGATAVTNQAVFVDTIGGYAIGVAYANPGASAANITVKLLNTAAQQVATTTLTLGVNNHNAKFTSELFTSAAPLVGTMQITSNVALPALALRFDPTFTVFTTIPPVTLASLLEPAAAWFKARPWAQPAVTLARLLGSLQFHMG